MDLFVWSVLLLLFESGTQCKGPINNNAILSVPGLLNARVLALQLFVMKVFRPVRLVAPIVGEKREVGRGEQRMDHVAANLAAL